MAKRSKLLAALDAHKGIEHSKERQKQLQKQAEKRKKQKDTLVHGVSDAASEAKAVPLGNGIHVTTKVSDDREVDIDGIVGSSLNNGVDVNDADDDDNNNGNEGYQVIEDGVVGEKSQVLPVNFEIASDRETDDEDQDGGIAFSDIETLSEDAKGDIIPHQRLTINNTTALLKAHRSIEILTAKLPFSEHQTVDSSTQISVVDVNDDLNRELAFYKQCLDATTEARILLKKEGIPFSRPTDYFAEMVKSDEHMGKINAKMTDVAASKMAAAEARKQRDLKKFGKAVQVAKLQERDKAKRETLDNINVLKRKRRDADTTNTNEEDLFDVALEDARKPGGSARVSRGTTRGANSKRQNKDSRFGFGGKKRFSKSGDAASTGDIRGFSTKKMKGQSRGSVRLGKSKRLKKV